MTTESDCVVKVFLFDACMQDSKTTLRTLLRFNDAYDMSTLCFCLYCNLGG